MTYDDSNDQSSYQGDSPSLYELADESSLSDSTSGPFVEPEVTRPVTFSLTDYNQRILPNTCCTNLYELLNVKWPRLDLKFFFGNFQNFLDKFSIICSLEMIRFLKSVYSILKFATENYIADDYMDECILCPSNRQGFPDFKKGRSAFQTVWIAPSKRL